jgi:cysteinyl-tRNA synthetase
VKNWLQAFAFTCNLYRYTTDLTPVQEGEVVTGFQQMEQAVAMEKVFAEFFHSVKGALRATPGGYSVDQEQTWGKG